MTSPVRRDSPTSNEDLALWLEFAVPLAMAELAILPDVERTARINGWMADGSRAIGANGDAMQFRCKPGRGQVGSAGLAKGVAAEAALNGTATHLGLTFVWPGARPPAVAEPVAPAPEPRPIKVVELPEADL